MKKIASIVVLVMCSNVYAMSESTVGKRLRNNNTIIFDNSKKKCSENSVSSISKDEFLKRLECIKKHCIELDKSRAERNILLMAFYSEFPQEKSPQTSDAITLSELNAIENNIIEITHDSELSVIYSSTVCNYAKLAARIERDLAKCRSEITAINKFTQLFEHREKQKDNPLLSMFT